MLNNIRQLLIYFISLVLLAQLAACGFRLRGEIDVPAELKKVHVAGIGAFAPLAQELRRVLIRSGTEVVPQQDQAQAIIRINNENIKRRVLSVDAQGRAAEYELIYQFQFDVNKSSGENIVPLQNIELTRDFRFDPANVLAKDKEEEQIRQ